MATCKRCGGFLALSRGPLCNLCLALAPLIAVVESYRRCQECREVFRGDGCCPNCGSGNLEAV